MRQLFLILLCLFVVFNGYSQTQKSKKVTKQGRVKFIYNKRKTSYYSAPKYRKDVKQISLSLNKSDSVAIFLDHNFFTSSMYIHKKDLEGERMIIGFGWKNPLKHLLSVRFPNSDEEIEIPLKKKYYFIYISPSRDTAYKWQVVYSNNMPH